MDKHKSSSKKIFCISVMQNWGGGEEFLLKLIKNIPDYEFVIVSPEGSVLNKFKENVIKVLVINNLKKIYKKSGWDTGSFLRIIFNIKISTLRLLVKLKAGNPSLILANGLFAALFVLPSAILSKRKLVVVQHLIFDEHSLEKKVSRLVYRYADKIVCVSDAVKENLLLMLNKKDSNKITVIPNGLDLPKNKNYDSEIKNGIKIGIVGTIIRIKGIHLVIDALKDILKSENATLHIFGTTADEKDSLDYKSELAMFIQNMGLEKKVTFEGYIESKEKIYSSLNIVINYSLIPESFSFTVIEAMAYKIIVISSNEGGPKELITDGETGFLVEPQNVDLLKEKILYCLKDVNSNAFDAIRERAFKTVRDKYSIEMFAARYKNLFNILIQ